MPKESSADKSSTIVAATDPFAMSLWTFDKNVYVLYDRQTGKNRVGLHLACALLYVLPLFYEFRDERKVRHKSIIFHIFLL